MKSMKVIVILIMVVACLSLTAATPGATEQTTPNLQFKSDIPITIGTCEDPVYRGAYFLKYSESPELGASFPQERKVFTDSWVIFDGIKTANSLTFERALNLVIRVWEYDPVHKTKTCRHLEMADIDGDFVPDLVSRRTFVEDKDNIILDSGKTETMDKPAQFAGAFQAVINEFWNRAKSQFGTSGKGAKPLPS
jgi:hypothetical protein